MAVSTALRGSLDERIVRRVIRRMGVCGKHGLEYLPCGRGVPARLTVEAY